MLNESAVTFWLGDRQVNDVLVAESVVEKLVKYAGRFYVVIGKAPEKKHYTQKTLPLLWRKMAEVLADMTGIEGDNLVGCLGVRCSGFISKLSESGSLHIRLHIRQGPAPNT